jgi:hypothetical protein
MKDRYWGRFLWPFSCRRNARDEFAPAAQRFATGGRASQRSAPAAC